MKKGTPKNDGTREIGKVMWKNIECIVDKNSEKQQRMSGMSDME